jgi:heptosyltransferase-2
MSRVLIVAPNWIGDTLLAQPLFARLHASRPGLALHAVAPSWTAPVLARMPEVEEVIETPLVHGRLQLGARLRLAGVLRENRYDEAIVLPNSWKSALPPFLAGIPRRVGFVGEARYGLLNVRYHLDEAAVPLMAERYALLAAAAGEPPPRPLAPPRLEVDEANLAIAIARFGLDRSGPVAVFCPGAEYGPAKRWPARHFAALARALGARGRRVWLIGSPADRAIAGGAAVNLCGRTDLASAIDLLSVAEVVVSNDSGLMHVAAALRRPLVALYGSSSPAHTPPLAPARLVSLGIECSPCFQRECPLGHFRCMNDLEPERVLAEIREVDPALA